MIFWFSLYNNPERVGSVQPRENGCASKTQRIDSSLFQRLGKNGLTDMKWDMFRRGCAWSLE